MIIRSMLLVINRIKVEKWNYAHRDPLRTIDWVFDYYGAFMVTCS